MILRFIFFGFPRLFFALLLLSPFAKGGKGGEGMHGRFLPDE